ncbi:MAG: hypothetical protein U1C46_09390 [Bacteroidales bacterium]|nr:hypothetical protein [Bacteroidales bacterium]
MLLSIVANIGHFTTPPALLPVAVERERERERENRTLTSQKNYAHPHRLAWPIRQYLLPVKDVPP